MSVLSCANHTSVPHLPYYNTLSKNPVNLPFFIEVCCNILSAKKPRVYLGFMDISVMALLKSMFIMEASEEVVKHRAIRDDSKDTEVCEDDHSDKD